MDRFHDRRIDEFGRLVLHDELRQKLRLEAGDKVSFTHVDTIVILQRVTDKSRPGGETCTLNDFGMITIPRELMDNIGWKMADKIALHHTDNIIILQKAKDKFVQRLSF